MRFDYSQIQMNMCSYEYWAFSCMIIKHCNKGNWWGLCMHLWKNIVTWHVRSAFWIEHCTYNGFRMMELIQIWCAQSPYVLLQTWWSCIWVIPRQIARKMAFLTPTPFNLDEIWHNCCTQWTISSHEFLGPGDLGGQLERSQKVTGFCRPWGLFGRTTHS